MFLPHTETLLSLCVMEKYSRVGRAILLLSGLARSGNRTMKDKAVSAHSVHQLRLSFISLSGVWVRQKILLAAFEVHFETLD